MTDPKRFHPQGDLLFLQMKPEKMQGKLHIPETVKVVVPVAEVLEAGPDVKKFKKGQQILVPLQHVMMLDKDLGFIAEPKVLALVDPVSVIESPFT